MPCAKLRSRLAMLALLFAFACRSNGLEVSNDRKAAPAVSPGLHVVSWNARKFSSPRAAASLASVIEQERPDLVFLQEATREALAHEAIGMGMDVYFAGSWRFPLFRRGPTGVATMTRIPTGAAAPLPSRRREFLVATPKVSLATEHPLPRGETLLAVNVHCLAFERFGTAGFRGQLASVAALLGQHHGPVVLAGDFNTWSQKRLAHLQGMTQRLALREADDFAGERSTAAKRPALVDWLLGIDAEMPLDRVYYRGFAGHDARVLPQRVSDHNALAVTLYPAPASSLGSR